MRARGYALAVTLAGLAYGSCLTSPTLTAFIPGIGTAQAKEFYTKKRVHGRWVSGRFPKKYAHHSSRRHEARVEVEPQRVAALPRPRPEREARVEPRAQAPLQSQRQAEPQYQPQPQIQTSEAPAPREDRLLKLKRALEARAQAIATVSATEVTSSVRPAELSSQKPRPEPRSVSFDFESGLKTTTFSSGHVVRENFDTGTLKGLAAPAPGNESVASASRP
jgi:hypothetical protein